jgi:PAS domain S-box-containing protein
MHESDFHKLKSILLENYSENGQITISEKELDSLKASVLDTESDLYRSTFDDVPCTISVVDSELKYIRVNETLSDLCGLTKEDFVGKQVGFYTENKFFLNFTRRLFESDSKLISQEIKTIIDGVDKYFWVSGRKIKDNSQCLLIGIDITDLKLLEGQVQFSEKLTALGEMVAGITHDIKNPLTVITGSAQMLKKTQKLDDEKILKFANRIESTSDRILKIVNSIKVFVRTGEDDPFVEEDLLNIINEAKDICNHKLYESKISFSVLNPEESFSVSMNVTKIFQVFVNLLSNACDELVDKEDNKGWVSIEFIESSKRIKVRDSGNGIDLGVQEKIFESFFTTKGVGIGSGLGLSNCKRIMQEHGGDIYIDNDDKNTCFIIDFSKNE